MLQQEDIVPLLLKYNLVTYGDIVDGALRVAGVSRRNRNFLVVREPKPGFFIKQGVGAEKVWTVTHDAMVCRLLAGTELGDVTPRFHAFDIEQCALVLEAPAGRQSLNARHAAGGVSARCSGALGAALGRLHNFPISAIPAAQRARLEDSRALPFAFQLHRPDTTIFRYASQGCLDLIRLVQASAGLCAHIEALGDTWSNDCLIHNDLRWDNCTAGGERRGQMALSLVDWELARAGDPAWDVGTALGEYLGAWVRSAPISGALPPESAVPLALWPVDRMKPAIRSLWSAYVRARHIDERGAGELLLRSVRSMAVRLVQTAFERVQRSMAMTAESATFVQLALNVLERPREASAALLGLALN
jgi:hypothetical protein